MKYWTVDIPYHSHRRRRTSKCVAAMGYIWNLWSHSFPTQWIASAFLPIHFPYMKTWQNWAPYQFHISTQPSHTIPRYGSYMAHVLPYHSHTFSLVRDFWIQNFLILSHLCSHISCTFGLFCLSCEFCVLLIALPASQVFFCLSCPRYFLPFMPTLFLSFMPELFLPFMPALFLPCLPCTVLWSSCLNHLQVEFSTWMQDTCLSAF